MGKYIAASNTKILENSHFDTVVVHRNVKRGRTRREERTHKADLVHLYREKKAIGFKLQSAIGRRTA
jgi:hypothetical protein